MWVGGVGIGRGLASISASGRENHSCPGTGVQGGKGVGKTIVARGQELKVERGVKKPQIIDRIKYKSD
jgi:hypothetical protein